VTGDTRAYLARVTIDGLLPAEHQISAPQGLDGHGQGIGCGPGIGASKGAAAEEHPSIAPHGHRLTDLPFRLRRPHADHRDAATVPFHDPQCLFDRVQVKGVDDRT